MSRTYTLPSGAKVRPKSQRRFILVRDDGSIVYRTDDLQRAIKAWYTRGAYIIDTAGSGKVRGRDGKWVDA